MNLSPVAGSNAFGPTTGLKTSELKTEVISVIGFIKSVNIGNKSCVVYDVQKDISYTIMFEGFLPLSENDAISGVISKLVGNMYSFIKKPLVKISRDRDTIIQAIRKALKFQISPSLINKLYDALIVEGNGESVDDYLDKMAINLHEKQIEDFGVLPDYLMESQFMKLLKWWYKSRTLRKLYLLGLNNKQIKSCEDIMELTPNQIYDKCMIDSFEMIPIPIDTCKTIYESLGKIYTEQQVYGASLVRKIYHNNVDKAWTGTPSKYVISEFKSINYAFMQDLSTKYGIVGELNTIYLGFHHKVETTMAQILAGMIREDTGTHEKKIIPVFTNNKLTEEQKNAVDVSLNNRLSIISGGPGSGKTYTIAEIVSNLERLKIPYAVASFTGKAVARLKEVLQKSTPATLHMMIARFKQICPFRKLIIDETSMVTEELLYFFCKIFGHDFDMILVGDKNQLQPISYGSLFSELIDCRCIDPIYLTKNHRITINGMDNDLLHNTNMMIDYYYRCLNRLPDEYIEPIKFREGNNFFRLEGNLELVFTIVKLMADKCVNCDDIMVMTPYNKYIEEINRGCQKIYNEGTTFVMCPRGIRWSVGDKIRVTSNNYPLGINNGDSGKVVDINPNVGPSGFPEMLVEFMSGRTIKFDVTYDPDMNQIMEMALGNDAYTISNNPTLSLITHGYCSTIDSMQGSECLHTILYLPREDKMNSSFINFNRLYTAITRAKNSCFVIGDIINFDLHCSTPPPYRVDNLGRRIRDLLGKN